MYTIEDSLISSCSVSGRRFIIRLVQPDSAQLLATNSLPPATCEEACPTPGCLPPLLKTIGNALLMECAAICKAWKMAISQVADHDVLL